MKILSSAVIKMATEMFLGLSIGDWIPTSIPSVNDHSLHLLYKGKKAKPFKLLYAAVRPSTPKMMPCICGEASIPIDGASVGVKTMRPTIYFNTFQINLKDQSIVMCGAKESLPEEIFKDLKRRNSLLVNDNYLVKRLLIEDFNRCLEKAGQVIQHRAEVAQISQRPKNPNNKLRRLAIKLIKEIYGEEATLSAEHNNGIAQYVLQTPDRILRFEGSDGTFGGENERDILRMVITHVSEPDALLLFESSSNK